MTVSVQDWERIGRAPVLVFALVASADGETSKEEMETFALEWQPRLKAFEITTDDLNRDLFQWALDEAASHWQTATTMPPDRLLAELTNAVELMDERFTERTAQAWKAALLQLGNDVAKASGGFLGLTNPVDSDERKRLYQINRILNP
jgi:tellurite resistance protein